MNQRIYRTFAILALLLSACSGGGGTVNTGDSGSLEGKLNSGKPLADLGKVEIHQGYIDLIQVVNPNIEGQLKNPAGKKRLVDSLLEQELFYQESMKRGIYKMPKYQDRVAIYSRVLLGQALLEEEIDKKAKEYYDSNKDKEFARVKVAHILIKPKVPTPPPPPPADKTGKNPPPPPPPVSLEPTPADDAAALKTAQEVKDKLDHGTQWGDAVTTYSMDLATKGKAGDMGYLTRADRRIQRLEWDKLVDQAFGMKIGETSAPIKAKDGYHIITLEEAPSVAPYEEVQNGIKVKLRGQVKSDLLTTLTGGAKTEYKDPELSSVPDAPPQMPIMLPPQGGAPTNSGPIQIQTSPPKAAAPAPAVDRGSEKKTPPKQPNSP